MTLETKPSDELVQICEDKLGLVFPSLMEKLMLKQQGYDLMGAALEVYNVLGYHGGRDLSTKPGN